MKVRGVVAGYLGLIVVYTAVSARGSAAASGLLGTLSKAITRLFDPTVPGLPDHSTRDSTDFNNTTPPDKAPPGAGTPPKCDPGFTPRYDTGSKRWRCIGDLPATGTPPGVAPAAFPSTVRA